MTPTQRGLARSAHSFAAAPPSAAAPSLLVLPFVAPPFAALSFAAAPVAAVSAAWCLWKAHLDNMWIQSVCLAPMLHSQKARCEAKVTELLYLLFLQGRGPFGHPNRNIKPHPIDNFSWNQQ